jgi:3-phosphoshikimate 1-carboxyvinyltransferase
VTIGQQVVVKPATRVSGTIRVPGDKSISHRYALLAAIASGRSTIHHYAPGGDCASTLQCVGALGVSVHRQSSAAGTTVVIGGRGLRGLTAAPTALDCGNSGSTMRMLAGVVAAHSFVTTLTGDRSLSRRPMRRVIEPLSRMGARIAAADERPPLIVHGRDLEGIDYAPEVSSAQVKSAVLLAGLQARGRSRVTERTPTRDHTERALAAFGAQVGREGPAITLAGGQALHGIEARVPGDISSAAFPIVAAAMLPGSVLTLEEVGLNPTRTALIEVLRRFGVSIEAEQTAEWQNEPVGRLHVRGPARRADSSAAGVPVRTSLIELGADLVPAIIDELPILAVLATAGHELRVTGASELRVKESDRITALVEGLRALGADADELPDGFHIRGRRPLQGARVGAHDDHRLAMAFAVAALTATGPVIIEGARAVAVSYPSFFDDVERLCA